MSVETSLAFDATAPWRLSDQVSLRDESFGALAYHHGNRRLVFLKSRELVEVVRALGGFDSARAAIAASVPADQHHRYEAALSALVKSGILDAGQ